MSDWIDAEEFQRLEKERQQNAERSVRDAHWQAVDARLRAFIARSRPQIDRMLRQVNGRLGTDLQIRDLRNNGLRVMSVSQRGAHFDVTRGDEDSVLLEFGTGREPEGRPEHFHETVAKISGETVSWEGDEWVLKRVSVRAAQLSDHDVSELFRWLVAKNNRSNPELPNLECAEMPAVTSAARMKAGYSTVWKFVVGLAVVLALAFFGDAIYKRTNPDEMKLELPMLGLSTPTAPLALGGPDSIVPLNWYISFHATSCAVHVHYLQPTDPDSKAADHSKGIPTDRRLGPPPGKILFTGPVGESVTVLISPNEPPGWREPNGNPCP